MDRIKYILNILIITVLFAAIAIGRDGKIFGMKSSDNFSYEKEEISTTQTPIMSTTDDGTTVINTTSLVKGVIGYAGAVPVSIYVKGEVIERVELEDNNETPSFLRRLINVDFLSSWNNMTLRDAATTNIDAVSGATYSSNAIAQNVQQGAAYATNIGAGGGSSIFDLKSMLGVLVVLLGVVLTFSKKKNKPVQIIYMVLNVGIIGFWCGSFLSLSQIISWLANGFNFSVSLVTITLLFVTLIMPLIGKKGTYCQHHCPMGAAQELVSLIPIKDIKINNKLAKFLNNLRYYILLALLFIMWIGVGFEILDYEVFSAFLYSSASVVVLIMAGVFILLSLIIKRPYCRFVCPTGALITMTQKTK